MAALQYLERQKAEAQKITSRGIPEARYGGNVYGARQQYQQAQEFQTQAEKAIENINQQREQARLQSPEYQQWAFNEAKRLIEAGAPVSFAGNAIIKSYSYFSFF